MSIPLEEVLKRLKDADWSVRYAACIEFGPSRSDIPQEEILRRLDDENHDVRYAASSVFDKFNRMV